MPRKYAKSSQDEVKKEMRRYKRGTAKSGSKGKKVKSRKQAIAIGLSKARKKGAKVPKKTSTRKSTRSTTGKTTRRSTTRKPGPKKSTRRTTTTRKKSTRSKK